MDRKTLCLWIPRFRTTVEAQTQPSWSALPLAIYARRANQRRLIEVSEAAQHAGLRPGMVVKEAAQRCPEGVYIPDDPARYGKAFEAVLGRAGRGFRRWWRTPGWGWRLPMRRGWSRCTPGRGAGGAGAPGTWKRQQGRLPRWDWRRDDWRRRWRRGRRGIRACGGFGG